MDDRRSDAAAGVRTLPVVYGIDTTRRVLVGVDVITLGLVVSGVVTGLIDVLVGMALAAGLVYSTITIVILLKRDKESEWTTIAPEFEYVVVAVALMPVVIGL